MVRKTGPKEHIHTKLICNNYLAISALIFPSNHFVTKLIIIPVAVS
jgi:hypothetical protein